MISGKILAGSNPEREEILLVASCYRNRDKLRPDGPLGLYADLTCYPTRPCQRSVFVAPPDLQIVDEIPWDTCVIAFIFCVFKMEF